MNLVSPILPGFSQPRAANDTQCPAGPPRQAAHLPVGAVFAGLVRRQPRDDLFEAAIRSRCARIRQVPSQVLPLAGYLLARQLNGCPVDPVNTARLRLADEAARSVQEVLPFGRGNVPESDRESQVRNLAAQFMHREFLRDGFQFGADRVSSFYAQAAMTAKVYGAGVCDSYASIAALAYGAKAEAAGARPGESVRLVSHTVQPHTWAEVHVPDRNLPAIVMDAWARGPAVFAADSRYAKDRAQVQDNASFDIAGAAQAHDWSDQFSLGLRANGLYDCRKEAEGQLLKQPPEPLRIPMQMLEPGFAGRAHKRLESRDPWMAVLTEVRALDVAKSLGGRGLPGLLADASKIVTEAKALVAPEAEGPASA